MTSRPPKSHLYTRAGDQGQTSLFGGKRVAKDDLRVEAYGCVDELNSVLGVVVAFLRQQRLIGIVQSIQNDLFSIGAELASPEPVRDDRSSGTHFSLSEDKVKGLEPLIDELDAQLPPLRNFILPSGSRPAAFLHLARTVCRRAERAIVTLSRHEPVNPNILAYMNRLSDLLFVLARYANWQAGREELVWRSRGPRS